MFLAASLMTVCGCILSSCVSSLSIIVMSVSLLNLFLTVLFNDYIKCYLTRANETILIQPPS